MGDIDFMPKNRVDNCHCFFPSRDGHYIRLCEKKKIPFVIFTNVFTPGILLVLDQEEDPKINRKMT